MSADLYGYIQDVMHQTGVISQKHLFGGQAIYLNGVIFALIFKQVIYLKTDAALAEVLGKKSLQPFEFEKNHQIIQLKYIEAPEEIYDDEEAALYWFKQAYAAAIRT